MATRKDIDPNEAAARLVHEATCRDEKAPADLESAWRAWSKGIQATDERTMTLLRAAFEAGYDSAKVDESQIQTIRLYAEMEGGDELK